MILVHFFLEFQLTGKPKAESLLRSLSYNFMTHLYAQVDQALSRERLFALTLQTYVLSWDLACRKQMLWDTVVETKTSLREETTEPFDLYVQTLDLLSLEQTQCRLALPEFHKDARAAALREFAYLALLIDSGNKRGNHGNGRILIGPKGTTLLHCFAIASAFLTSNTTVIFANCMAEDLYLPSQLLLHGYAYDSGHGLPSDGDDTKLQSVLGFLMTTKRRFLLVFDEFHNVYKRPGNQPFVRQLHCLGNNTTGEFGVFISGSDSSLFGLCFGYLPLDFTRYPSYEKCSLNNERYKAVHSSPIRSYTAFESLLNHISMSSTDSPLAFFSTTVVEQLTRIKENSERLSMMYTFTGGRFRALQSYCQDPKACVAEDIRKFVGQLSVPIFGRLLSKLLERHNDYYALHKNEDHIWVDVWLTYEDVRSVVPQEEMHLIYQIGNNGMLLLDTCSPSLEPRVTFACKLHELLWRKHEETSSSLSYYNRIFLTYGQLGIDVEDLVCKILGGEL